MSIAKWNVTDELDAELLDVLQENRAKQGLPMNVRTAETRTEYPLPGSHAMPKLACPYCGRKRCKEHKDLPSLDPYFNA